MRSIGFAIEQAAVGNGDLSVGAVDGKSATGVIRKRIGQYVSSVDILGSCRSDDRSIRCILLNAEIIRYFVTEIDLVNVVGVGIPNPESVCDRPEVGIARN
jgi:hypothetical protein